mgnify:CR=1 FL=1
MVPEAHDSNKSQLSQESYNYESPHLAAYVERGMGNRHGKKMRFLKENV